MTYATEDTRENTDLTSGVRQWETQMARIGKGGLKASSAMLVAFSLAACDLGGGGGGGGGDDDDNDPDPISGDVTLTTGADTVVADIDSNTITSPLVTESNIPNLMTLTTGDTIDGGAGTDALVITTFSGTTAGFSVVNVETITLTNASTGISTLSFGGVNLTGVTEIRLADNVGAVILNDLNGVAPITIANNNKDVSLTYTAAAVSGATTQSITLEQVTQNGTDWDLDIGAGIETMTLLSSGTSANSINSIDSVDVTTLAIAGDQNLTIAGIENANVAAINGASATGDLAITQINNTGNVTMLGGTGNDTFTLGAEFDVTDVISGGAGTDSLSVTQSAITAIASTASNVTAIETIQVSDALADNGTIGFHHFSATRLELMDGTAGVATLSLKTGDVVQVTGDVGDGTVATDHLTLDMATNGTSDGATLILSGATLHGNLVATELEALTVETTGGATLIKGTTTLDASTTSGTETLTVKGDQGITFRGAIEADIIDAADLTGDLRIEAGVSGTGLNNAIITSGDGNDYLGFGDDLSNTIAGGSGNDQIVFDIDFSDTVTGGAGSDNFIMETDAVFDAGYSSNSVATTITDFSTSDDALTLVISTMDEWVSLGSLSTAVTDGNGNDVAAATTPAITSLTSDGTGINAGDIIALAGGATYANAAAALADIAAAGNRTFATGNNLDNDDGMILAYETTGGDLEIALIRMDGTSSDSDDFDAIDVMIVLDDVSMTEFLTANLDIIA